MKLTNLKARSRLVFPTACCVAWAAWLTVCQLAVATDSGLPDGTEYVSWEKPLQFSKTYYVDCNSAQSNDSGPGSIGQPFRTIGKAAEVLQPGERVVIAAGIYRECVRPTRGGTGPDQMISYEAAPGAAVIVRGSETLNDGWQQASAGTTRGGGGGSQAPIWQHALTGAMFPDAYNPFALADVPGDWSWLDTKKVDMGPYFRRRGMVFVNGKPLEPVEQLRELGNTRLQPAPQPAISATNEPPAQPANRSGLPARTRGGPIMQEIGGSPDARFWVAPPGNMIDIRVPAETPAKPLIEITTREQVFAPLQKGLGYIRVKGITFQQAANGFPPPQRGLVSTAGGNHWIIESNTIEWASGVGLDIGNGDRNSGPAPQAGAFQIVRGNTIRYCGVEGLGGMGTQNTVVEDNLIEWVGWQDAERAWEAAGAKFHSSRSLIFRRNVVRHIRHANAVWLDSGNSNCRITGNVFADVLTVSAAVHIEMSRKYNQIDNNVIWNVRNAEPGTPGQRGAAGSGIFLNASDCLLVAQNLIGCCDNAGFFPIVRDDRAGSGTAQENHIFNNIFASCGKAAYVFIDTNNYAGGNVFASMPGHYLWFGTNDLQQRLDLPGWQSFRGWESNSVTASMKLDFDPDRLELTMSSETALPKVSVFNHIDSDMLGNATGETRAAGPLGEPGARRVWQVDPRQAHRQASTSGK
jgi:hypothetical protein